MMTLDALMQHLKYQDATHLITQDDGHLIAYRKNISGFKNHFAFLHISKDGDSYKPGMWLLTERELPETAKVIEYAD